MDASGIMNQGTQVPELEFYRIVCFDYVRCFLFVSPNGTLKTVSVASTGSINQFWADNAPNHHHTSHFSHEYQKRIKIPDSVSCARMETNLFYGTPPSGIQRDTGYTPIEPASQPPSIRVPTALLGAKVAEECSYPFKDDITNAQSCNSAIPHISTVWC
jgi:hypothetical protein